MTAGAPLTTPNRPPDPLTVPVRVPWQHLRRTLDWRQGQHVTLIGPTGSGKTTLIQQLLPMRRHVMFLATKRRDEVVSAIEADGFRRMERPADWYPRIIIYPPFPADAAKMQAEHRRVFRDALMYAYRAGYWCVVADEVRYLSQILGLERELQTLWLQGRSLGVSLVAATQRPRHVPLEAYDQPDHLFLWRDSDQGNIRRLAEIGGSVNVGLVQRTVPQLARHDFLYVNTRTGDTIISNAKG